jgi:hypothetical protein
MTPTNGLRNLLAVTTVTTILAGCGPASAGDPKEPAKAEEADMVRFKPLVVRDRLAGRDAFSLLIPADWRGEGAVDWRFHPQYPAAARVRAYNPNGVEAVHSYPMIPFVWGVWHLPEGGSYIGNEVRPVPRDPEAYVRQYLLPHCRPDIKNFRVVAVEDMPEWAKTSTALADARANGIPCKVQAGRVRIAYVVDEQKVEEEFSVMLVNLSIVGCQYWGTEWASSVRAAPGKLEPVHRAEMTMASSVRFDLTWYSQERNVAATFEQMIYDEQAAVMARSRIIAEANNHVTEVIRTSYENRQKALDRINARFSEYIRGVESYQGPDGHTLQLPAGYRHAWVNNRGEYVLSDNANFDPNVSLRGDWRELKRAR